MSQKTCRKQVEQQGSGASLPKDAHQNVIIHLPDGAAATDAGVGHAPGRDGHRRPRGGRVEDRHPFTRKHQLKRRTRLSRTLTGSQRLRRAVRSEKHQPARTRQRAYRRLHRRSEGIQRTERAAGPELHRLPFALVDRNRLRPEQYKLQHRAAGIHFRAVFQRTRLSGSRLLRDMDALRQARLQAFRQGRSQRQPRSPVEPGRLPARRRDQAHEQRHTPVQGRSRLLGQPPQRGMACQGIPEQRRTRRAGLFDLPVRRQAGRRQRIHTGQPAQGIFGSLHARSQCQGLARRNVLHEQLGRQRIPPERPAAQLDAPFRPGKEARHRRDRLSFARRAEGRQLRGFTHRHHGRNIGIARPQAPRHQRRSAIRYMARRRTRLEAGALSLGRPHP